FENASIRAGRPRFIYHKVNRNLQIKVPRSNNCVKQKIASLKNNRKHSLITSLSSGGENLTKTKIVFDFANKITGASERSVVSNILN
ncbi:hypothetical protein VU07_05805, partial [Desulfobulbus sp. F4]|nr:hypothetical protein [Desulfobulbus sp. F4]